MLQHFPRTEMLQPVLPKELPAAWSGTSDLAQNDTRHNTNAHRRGVHLNRETPTQMQWR